MISSEAPSTKKIFHFLLSVQSKSLLLYKSFDTLVKIIKENSLWQLKFACYFHRDTMGVTVLQLSGRNGRVWKCSSAGWVNKSGECGRMSNQKNHFNDSDEHISVDSVRTAHQRCQKKPHFKTGASKMCRDTNVKLTHQCLINTPWKERFLKRRRFCASNMPLVEATKKPPTCANCVVSIFHFQDDQIEWEIQ